MIAMGRGQATVDVETRAGDRSKNQHVLFVVLLFFRPFRCFERTEEAMATHSYISTSAEERRSGGDNRAVIAGRHGGVVTQECFDNRKEHVPQVNAK